MMDDNYLKATNKRIDEKSSKKKNSNFYLGTTYKTKRPADFHRRSFYLI
jgi:hypothetical protein